MYKRKSNEVINMNDDLMIRPAARARITKCSHLYSTFGRLEANTCEALQQAQTVYRQQQQEVEMDSTADSVLFSSDDMDWTSSTEERLDFRPFSHIRFRRVFIPSTGRCLRRRIRVRF